MRFLSIRTAWNSTWDCFYRQGMPIITVDLVDKMSGKKTFLAGCGSGMLALLVAATLLPKRKRSSRSTEGPSCLPEHSPVEAERRDAIDAAGGSRFDRQSNPAVDSSVPEAEHQDQALGNLASTHSKDGDPPAHRAPPPHPDTQPARYRRLRATDWITTAAAVIATVAVTYFGVTFQKQMNRVTAQLTQSETTMRIVEEGTRADQRAWVGLTEVIVQPLTANGGGFTIKLENTGKTPALDLQVSDVITVEDIDESAPLQEPNISTHNPAGTLMPGAAYTTDVWFKTSPDAISSLSHDQLRAVNYVHVIYKDVFQRPHATKVCFYWRSSLPRVKPCEGYNELN